MAPMNPSDLCRVTAGDRRILIRGRGVLTGNRILAPGLVGTTNIDTGSRRHDPEALLSTWKFSLMRMAHVFACCLAWLDATMRRRQQLKLDTRIRLHELEAATDTGRGSDPAANGRHGLRLASERPADRHCTGHIAHEQVDVELVRLAESWTRQRR